MSAPGAVRDVLDRAADRGGRIDLWWRDDDAVRPSAPLTRLLDVADGAGAPVSLAVIPALAERALADRLAAHPRVAVLVHGWRHADHSPAGAKRAEFGDARPLPDRERDAEAGRDAVRRLFGARARPVFVPPWNRIGPDLVGRLARLGYAGLSTFGRREAVPAGAPRVVNTHLDPVDWRGARGPVDWREVAGALASASETGEPVGLLTHHCVFDEALWSFTTRLAEILSAHPATRWRAIDDLCPGAVIEPVVV